MMNELKEKKKTLLRFVLERNFYKSENYENYKFQQIFCKILSPSRQQDNDEQQCSTNKGSSDCLSSNINGKRMKLSS